MAPLLLRNHGHRQLQGKSTSNGHAEEICELACPLLTIPAPLSKWIKWAYGFIVGWGILGYLPIDTMQSLYPAQDHHCNRRVKIMNLAPKDMVTQFR